MVEVNTLLGVDLFGNEIKESFIFHIPHSKTEIPKEYLLDYVDVNLTNKEIELLTDFATDEIFNIDGTDKLIFLYSRVFCDVERLDDDNEVMFQYGRGFYYTKTDSGELLREMTSKEIIFEKYYKKHHESLSSLVKEKIEKNGFVTIIDCHSFANTPFKSDLVQSTNRPDFCLGTDKIHTPNWLINLLRNFLINNGYSVEIDSPYSGTIVPIEYYNNKNIYSIMIEVNRNLYMENNVVNPDKVKQLNKLFNEFFNY